MSGSGSGSGPGSPESGAREQLLASSSGINEPGPQTPTIATGNERPAAAEKTISCISCRGRKLKCDRVKPKCGTCIRLRNNCEYPERRRNVGTRRRNMRDLEARLGTSGIPYSLLGGLANTPKLRLKRNLYPKVRSRTCRIKYRG